MDVKDLFKSVNALRKQGRVHEALILIRSALQKGELGPEAVERAGRFLARELAGSEEAVAPLGMLLLGQCTTSWLVPTLTAVAWRHGSAALVAEGGYDNILQDLEGLPAGSRRPDVVVLLPWNQRLLGGEPFREQVDYELELWQRAWDLVGRMGSRLLQVGYDCAAPGPAGHHLGGADGGPVALIRTMNTALRQNLPPGAFYLDLEQVSGVMGRRAFYDARRYYWTKQPFSERGALELAEHLWAGTRALMSGPKKVLVLDLDNTLWGGVVGETGPRGISIGESPDGEAFRALQAHCKALTRRGVLLAVASKNNLADAREPFEVNPDMLLKLDDFAAFEACWDPKAVMIERIARTLNLGLDSFVFLDDNPAERELIRQALPEVEVIEVGDEPAEFLGILQAGLWFEAAALTEADRERAEQYSTDRRRRELESSFTSLDDYLRSLEMSALVRTIDDDDISRVVQLLAKTNQFNLTTRRHTREDVRDLLVRPGAIGITIRVRDRFGDHGLVAVMIGVPADEACTIRLDTWLMSCRVIGRTVEQFCFGVFLTRSQALGYRRILGDYIPTKKNALVSELYHKLGFTRLSDPDGANVRYELILDAAVPPACFLADFETTVESKALVAT
jgi:FkbH-like protein